MYDYTSDYSRKVENIRKAGLNPQMLLSGAGSGGTTGQGVGGAGGNAPEAELTALVVRWTSLT